MNYFKLRGKLPPKTDIIVMMIGLFTILTSWQTIVKVFKIPPALLPAPTDILMSIPELHFKNELVRNMFYSLKLNLLGYTEAILLALPLGFIIGLFPVFRSLFSRYIAASRFIPLAATTGIFIVWFGLFDNMKVQFLAVSIFVYLLPVVIQRLDEVAEVYEQTAFTLGANTWQMIKTVFIPAVKSSIIGDIRVLVAVSWTYITIAEAINRQGGLGDLALMSGRQSRPDKVFAVILIIVLIGFLQDKLFEYIDKQINPHKYA